MNKHCHYVFTYVRHGIIRDKFSEIPNINTGCPRRNVRDFGRVFLMLNYTDITQNTYIQS